MVTPRITKALNPHRKLTAKQIRAGFGGKRRLASLKASKKHSHKRPKAKASNPKKRKRRATAKAKNTTRIVYRTKYKTRTKKVYVKPKRKANAKAKRRSSNPGQYLLTMAPVGNPHKKRRKTSMAKTKRRASAKGRSGKRKNPTRRRSVARRNHRPRGSRNPIGVSSGTVKSIFGAAVGFSVGKKVPPLFGPSMNSSPMMTLLSTGITAAVMAWAARKFAPAYADGVLIGGGMAVLNVAWNAWAPASIAGYSALGDFVNGGFPLPQGPVRFPMVAAPDQAPNGSQVNLSAFYGSGGRAW